MGRILGVVHVVSNLKSRSRSFGQGWADVGGEPSEWKSGNENVKRDETYGEGRRTG